VAFPGGADHSCPEDEKRLKSGAAAREPGLNLRFGGNTAYEAFLAPLGAF
jgi:hypothetical protein